MSNSDKVNEESDIQVTVTTSGPLVLYVMFSKQLMNFMLL